jgi:hypothetical protein
VGGQPFDQLRTGGWSWLHEGDRLDQHMLCAIVDVAHMVTTSALKDGDLGQARARPSWPHCPPLTRRS